MHVSSVLFITLLFISGQRVVICFLNHGANLKVIPGRLSTKPTTTKHRSLASSTYPHFQEAAVFNGILGTILSRRQQSSLTQEGILHATALGTALWSLLGVQGWLVCVFYFTVGSLATNIKMKEKEVRTCGLCMDYDYTLFL